MKKIFIIIMIFVMLLSFSSCSKPQEEDTPPQNIVDTTNKTTDTDEETVPNQQPEVDDKAETEDLTDNNEKPTDDAEYIPVADSQTDESDTEQADPSVNDEAEVSDGEIYFPSKNPDNVSTHVSVKQYQSTAELYSEASAVVVATVTSHGKKANTDGRIPITVSSLKIEKVLKGSLSEGNSIYVHETGQIAEKHDVSVEGIPLLKKKMKVLLYLTDPTDYYIGEDSYGICGVYQGKFFYNNDGHIHSAIDFAKSELPALSDFKEPMKEAAVMTAIDAVKAQQAVK